MLRLEPFIDLQMKLSINQQISIYLACVMGVPAIGLSLLTLHQNKTHEASMRCLEWVNKGRPIRNPAPTYPGSTWLTERSRRCKKQGLHYVGLGLKNPGYWVSQEEWADWTNAWEQQTKFPIY